MPVVAMAGDENEVGIAGTRSGSRLVLVQL